MGPGQGPAVQNCNKDSHQTQLAGNSTVTRAVWIRRLADSRAIVMLLPCAILLLYCRP